MSARCRRCAVLVAGLLVVALGSRAEPLPMVFTHLSTEQGLSQATVNDVLQDSQGFIWLATQNGLNRYDGVELKRYYRDPEGSDGLASDYVVALDEDRFGNIWIATDGGGVAVWNRRTDTIRSYRHRNGDARSLASDQVHDVLVDRSGHVWIATRDRGLDRLDPRSGAITHFVHDATRPESLGSNRNLYALLEDRDGAIWVSSSVGLDRHVGLHRWDRRHRFGESIVRRRPVRLPASCCYCPDSPFR